MVSSTSQTKANTERQNQQLDKKGTPKPNKTSFFLIFFVSPCRFSKDDFFLAVFDFGGSEEFAINIVDIRRCCCQVETFVTAVLRYLVRSPHHIYNGQTPMVYIHIYHVYIYIYIMYISVIYIYIYIRYIYIYNPIRSDPTTHNTRRTTCEQDNTRWIR